MAFIPYSDPNVAAKTVAPADYQYSTIAPYSNTSTAIQAAAGTPEYQVAAANAATGFSGGGTGTSTVNPNIAQDTAAIANTNKSLAQLPGILQAALDANNQQYANAEQGFNTQEQAQRGQYEQGTTTNQQNYDSNLMASLRAGATGLSGLLSILRGTGAEGWANQAVGDTTSSDIRTGLNTQQQNQTGLDTSLSGFLTDLADKRNQNKQTLTSNEFAARGQNATQLQDLYTKLAGYYADMGDNANATAFLNRAGDLASEVARYGVAPVAAYNTTPAKVVAPAVTAFSAPTQQSITATDPNASSNGIFTVGDARKRLAGAGA